MSDHTRPLLLGYIRADVLSSSSEVPEAEADLEAFANREEFSLGTVYVERSTTRGAFHALLSEVDRNEAAWAVVVPDLRHVTQEEQLVLTHEEHFVQTAILPANSAPCSGGPGVFPA